nr:hypothetical protein [uncultured Psychroserpens sp.]
MKTKTFIKTVVTLSVFLLAYFLNFHALEGFSSYLQNIINYHVIDLDVLFHFEVFHLVIDLFPFPLDCHQTIKKHYPIFSKWTARLYIVSSVICNVLTGTYIYIAVDFCWFAADILIEKVEHNIDAITEFFELTLDISILFFEIIWHYLNP